MTCIHGVTQKLLLACYGVEQVAELCTMTVAPLTEHAVSLVPHRVAQSLVLTSLTERPPFYQLC